MMEKNHKHEMGVEIAHHKEVQRSVLKLSEENRELKVKLEVKKNFCWSFNLSLLKKLIKFFYYKRKKKEL